MNPHDYKEKLIRFNSTKGYQLEMEFFKCIIQPKKEDKILDFGCGVGTFTKYMREFADVKGYDCVNYFDKAPNWFYNKNEFRGFDKVYFMHSLAHIYELKTIIKNLPLSKGGRVYVLTPNLMWLSSMSTRNYTPDPTVVKHFNANNLRELFKEWKLVMSGSYGSLSSNYHERLFMVVEK